LPQLVQKYLFFSDSFAPHSK